MSNFNNCFALKFKYLTLTIFQFKGSGFGKVWLEQWTLQDTYKQGDFAVLQCKLNSQGETIKGCQMLWVILPDINKKYIEDVNNLAKFQKRVQIDSNDTFSSMILNKLTTNDTEKLYCTASCFIGGKLKLIAGNGTLLTITGE